jgi:hypothetical protein
MDCGWMGRWSIGKSFFTRSSFAKKVIFLMFCQICISQNIGKMAYSCGMCDAVPAVDRDLYCHPCWLRLKLFEKLLEQYNIPREVFSDMDLWEDLYRM